MREGYVLSFKSSSNQTAYICDPTIFGQYSTRSYPWMRAAHRASVFETAEEAIAAGQALRMARIFEAPECNNFLDKRLGAAQPIFVSHGVTIPGVELCWLEV